MSYFSFVIRDLTFVFKTTMPKISGDIVHFTPFPGCRFAWVPALSRTSLENLFEIIVVRNWNWSDVVFRRNATHCISPYATVVYVCVCRVCGPQENGLRWRRHFFKKLLEMTPDIIYKSFTQIGWQISRWRTKWRPWNTIIGRNSAIY